jgi:hypothetical protein
MNLYDKWAAKDWHQLWADDTCAFIILADGKKFKVVADNGRIVTTYRAKDLSDAFDDWNEQINRHLKFRVYGQVAV